MSLPKRFVKTFRKNDDGAAAVEFGFFAIPFVFLLIGMVEVGMLSTAGTLLQGGTDDAARLIRTGQAQSSGDPQAAFEDLLCEKVDLMINCNNLVFEAIAIDSSANGFGGIADDMSLVDPTFDSDGNLEPSGFDSGSHSSLVIVRVAYNYPLMTPFVGPFLADNTNNTKLLMATAIIQNEPYDF